MSEAAGSRQQAAGGRAKLRSYRDLIAWKKAIDLAEAAYRLTAAFPAEERFGATSQIRRAAASVAANIAEGYGRGTRVSYLSFLRIARGSLRELETHLIIAERVRLAPAGDIRRLLELCDEEARILQGLVGKLEAIVR